MSSGKIAESDLSGMFGIDMEETIDLDLPAATKKASGAGKKSRKASKAAKTGSAGKKPTAKAPAKKKGGLKSPAKPGSKKRSQPAAAKAHPRKTAVKSPAKKKNAVLSVSGQVLKIIDRSRKGIDVATLRLKTGFDEKKIRNIIYKAHKDGVITRAGRGIYLGADRKKERK
jgi:hypothetical protein